MKSDYAIRNADDEGVEQASTDPGNNSQASLRDHIVVWTFVVLVFLTVLVVGLVNKGDDTINPLHEESGSGNLLGNPISN